MKNDKHYMETLSNTAASFWDLAYYYGKMHKVGIALISKFRYLTIGFFFLLRMMDVDLFSSS